MSIKIVAIDLDGTLLQSDRTISQENKDAILKAKEAGVKVVLTTGRPLKATELYLEECQLMDEGDYGITYNGGLIQETKSGKILTKIAMADSEVKEVYELLETLNLPMSAVGFDKIHETPHEDGRPSLYREIQPLLAVEENTKVDELPTIVKIVSARTVEEIDAAIEKIPASYFDKFMIVKSQPTLLEFMTQGVHKANGLKKLGEELGITKDEIMAIGDMENDATMIEYAGIGVAMGNADQKIKDLSQFVTKTNDEHGVAHAIQKFVLD